jgi:hypothetical protein
MTDVQLYFAIGLPVFAFLLNIAAGLLQTSSINSRITSVEARIGAGESTTNSRIEGLESTLSARIAGLESTMNSRFNSLETRFETLTGKVVEIDNRLTRVEERLLHL